MEPKGMEIDPNFQAVDSATFDMAGNAQPGPTTPALAPEPPKVPKPRLFDEYGIEYFEKPDGSKVDKNGIKEEDWPTRNEMLDWIDTHRQELDMFVRCKGQGVKIQGGAWFDFDMINFVLRLSVPEYKKMREKADEHLSVDQYLFTAFHEFGHMRSKIELNRLEVANWEQHLNYEASKSYETLDENGRRVVISLGGAYHHFYNVMEDPIVNRMVLNTHHYSKSLEPERYQQVVEMYRQKFFQLFLPCGEGEGDYAEEIDKDAVEKMMSSGKPINPAELPKKHVFVGEGKGNLRLLKKEDYDKGVDFNEVLPKMSDNRSGQFVTYFMKNQMAELPSFEVRDPKVNPEGKHILHEDVAQIFNRPLFEVYTNLLDRFVEVYKDNHEKMELYLKFMSDSIPVTRFKDENGQVVKDVPPIKSFPNIFYSLAVNKSGDRIDYKAPISKVSAQVYFEGLLKQSLPLLGRSANEATSIKYMDVYNDFTKLNTSIPKRYGLTQFQVNMHKRTEIIRAVLEPIYSLLCILDDTFKSVVPPERPKDPNGGEGDDPPPPGGGDPVPKMPPVWRAGDRVVNVNPGSPNENRVGQVIRVERDTVSEKVISVDVEYYDEYIDKSSKDYKYEMSDGNGSALPKGYESEIFYSPDKDLALYVEEGKSQEEGNMDEDDDRKKVIKKAKKEPTKPKPEDKDKDKKKKKDKKDKGDDENDDDDDDDADPTDGDNDDESDKDPKDEKKPKSGDGTGKEEKPRPLDMDNLDESIQAQKDLLEKIKEIQEKEGEAQDVIDERKTNEYQNKKNQKNRVRNILDELRKKRKELGKADRSNPDLDEATIAKVMELEGTIAEPANELAKAWAEIIRNIVHEIELVKELARVGKLDIKRVQRRFLELVEGKDLKNMLLYEQMMEVLKTDIKPKMMRLILLVDNSGSMSGAKMDQLKFSVMLLNESLRSLRVQFQDEMQTKMGNAYSSDLDLICDIQIISFGSCSHVVKPFEVKDLAFLKDKKAEKPPIDLNSERVATILAFEQLTADESTYDAEAWTRIILEHEEDPMIKTALEEGLMTEVIIQVTDGDIEDWSGAEADSIKSRYTKGGKRKVATARDMINELKRQHPKIKTAGFSIGDEEAYEKLKSRHGDNVIRADTSDQIVQGFTKYLKDVVESEIETPMIKSIRQQRENTVE
jgi:hypothetical protein